MTYRYPTLRSVVGFASSLTTGGVSNGRAPLGLWTITSPWLSAWRRLSLRPSSFAPQLLDTLLAIDSYPPASNRLYRESPRRSGYGSLGLGVLYSYVFVQDLLSCLSGYEVLYLTAEGYECNRSGDEDRRESTEYYTENHREREAAYAVTTEDEDAQEHEER